MKHTLLAALFLVACTKTPLPHPPERTETPVPQQPERAASAAPVDAGPRAEACPLAPLQLRIQPTSAAGAAPRTTEVMTLDADGTVRSMLSRGQPLFVLRPEGCLLFRDKLIAEMLPDGRIVDTHGELLATLQDRTLAHRDQSTELLDDGTLRSTPAGRLADARLVGFDRTHRCAGAMLLTALGQATAGASIAASERAPAPSVPPPPGSRCADVPR